MKKFKYLIIILMAILIPNLNVFAATASLSVSSSNVYVGDSFTVKANVYSAASWNIHVKASGPVSGCIIGVADATVDALDANKMFSTTCKATGEGKITVVLSGDATSATADNADDVSASRVVTVSKKVSPNYSTNHSSTKSNSSSTSTTNKSAKEENNNKSKNNSLKEIKVEGYELTRVDTNNYTLTVTNDVEKVNVIASAEDAKAKVTGAGTKSLNIGENLIEILVVSESGAQNKINVKITRKSGFFLEDLDSVLKKENIKNININIDSNTKITKSDLEKIKSSKKVVSFNHYNGEIIKYTWVIDGSSLGEVNDLLTGIVDSKNKQDMLRLSNYADGIYISLDQKDNLPTDTRIRYYVGDKYKDKDLINIYSYDKTDDKLNEVMSKTKVKDGYIKFVPNAYSDYLITMSTIKDDTVSLDKKSTNVIMVMLISIIILLIILICCVLMYKKRKIKRRNS